MTDWALFRSQFPALANHTYLNTAGGGVMSTRVAAAGRKYYDESEMLGDIAWDPWIERSKNARGDVAQFIGGAEANVAFLPNASLGVNILARSFERGSRILAIDQEFPSCTTPFLRAGCDVRFIPTEADGYVDSDLVQSHIDSATRAFILSSVQFANGFRADLGQIGRACREAKVLFIVDATQSIGAFPIDMETDFIDAVVFSGYKWATAGYGVAVLVTGECWPVGDPPLIGWRSARNAYELENDRLDLLPSGIGHEMGHPAFPGIFAMGEAVRLLGEIGPEQMSLRIGSIVDRLWEGLTERNVSIRSHAERKHRSGIMLADFEDAAFVCAELRKKAVWTTSRDGGLRISAHGYNDELDVERFFESLDALEVA